jgi:hypothetical protein
MRYFSSLGRPVMSYLCFCIFYDLWVTKCILVCLGRETPTHYLGEPGTDPTKSTLRHVTPNMCFCIWWDL